MGPRTSKLVLAGFIVWLGGCGPRDTADGGEEAVVEDVAVEETGMDEAMPAATAEAVWGALEAADFRNNWELWPGKGALYTGGDPHGALLTTYLNPAAAAALAEQAGVMPLGAILVKDNFMPDSTLAATTVMYKAADFDPDHDNWFWLKRLADGTVEASGIVEGCIGCHGAQADNDYVLTASLSQ